MASWFPILFLLVSLLHNGMSSREARFLSLFSVVKFPNSMCPSLQRTADGQPKTGTCFRASECASNRGLPSGACAAGFGVCCIFALTAGTVRQNCTYIRNEGFPEAVREQSSSPAVTVRKCTSGVNTSLIVGNSTGSFDSFFIEDVCSVRLDFQVFSLAGPSDTLETLGGACATESLVIESSTNEPFPTICGQNTGQHVYVDLGGLPTDTATFSFTLTSNSIYEIKVSQIECGALLSQPDTCFQYFTEPTGTISTFNFLDATSSHLANQRYTVCIRPARGMCCVEYTACADANSQSLSGQAPALVGAGVNNNAVDSLCLNDYVILPDATTSCSANQLGPLTSRFCGRVLNTQVNSAADSDFLNIPICDCVPPFELTVVTDAAAEANSNTTPNRGFCVNYRQLPC